MTLPTILHDAPIAFIGTGAMGEAMIGGLLRHKLVEPDAITASDLHQSRLDEVKRLFGVRTTDDNRAAVRKARIVVLSVKPQVLSTVCADLNGVLRPSTLVVSIVAGARISSMAAGLNHEAIVRTMPNTPAQIGEGMTVWAATDAVSDKQREQAGAILGALFIQTLQSGMVLIGMDTSQQNIVIGVVLVAAVGLDVQLRKRNET